MSLLALYALACLALYLGQTRLLFHPTRVLEAFPERYEDVFLRTSDGETLHGWAVPGSGEGWVLHCHGTGWNISARLEVVRILHSLGWGVLLFDYRGYGRSSGRLTCEGDLFQDAEAAWQYLSGRSSRVVIWGESLGGGVASALASRHACAGLVLQSTFTSLRERLAQSLPFLPVRWLCRYPLDTLSRAKTLACPKLILHSPDDEVISVSHGRRLFAEACPPKVWGDLTGNHQARNGPALVPVVGRWLAEL